MVINGMPVISNPFAREIRDEFHVEKSTIKKRRRNWMVVKHHIDKPGIYLMDGRVYVAHPEIIQELSRQLAKGTM